MFRTNAVIVIDIGDLIIDDKTREYDKNIEKIGIWKYVSKSREMNDSIWFDKDILKVENNSFSPQINKKKSNFRVGSSGGSRTKKPRTTRAPSKAASRSAADNGAGRKHVYNRTFS